MPLRLPRKFKGVPRPQRVTRVVDVTVEKEKENKIEFRIEKYQTTTMIIKIIIMS